MPYTPARFTQADIARALRAVKDAGGDMAVEIAPDGTIRIVPHEPVEPPRRRPLDGRKEIRM
jgi:hypothetical protein